MHDRFVVCLVVALTIIWALAAIGLMKFGPTPPTVYSERLFDTFVSLTAAGFFTVLGLLAAHG